MLPLGFLAVMPVQPVYPSSGVGLRLLAATVCVVVTLLLVTVIVSVCVWVMSCIERRIRSGQFLPRN